MEYSIDGGATWQSSNTFTVPSGSYSIKYREVGSLCIGTVDIIVPLNPNLVNANYTITDVACSFGATGSIDMVGINGTAPYLYSINGGTPQTSGLFTNLSASTYLVHIVDALGCPKDSSITITQLPPLEATAFSTTPTCATLGLGTITVTVNGATVPMEYSIDGGTTWQLSNIFTAPPADYTIQYREPGASCIGSVTVNVPSNPTIVNGTYAISNIRCNGDSPGSIDAVGVNGTAPYLYSINGGIPQSSGLFANLPANSYQVLIIDAVGCPRDTTIIITEPTAILADTATTNATCSASANGTITVNATGGTPGYEYSYDGFNYQASNIFTVYDNTYDVWVRDANGCKKTITGVVVGLTNTLTLTTRTDTTLCLGGSITLTTTSNASSYSWTGNGLDDYTAANPVATPSLSGNNPYQVTASLGQCSTDSTINILADAQVNANAGNNATILLGDQIQLNGTMSGATSILWTSLPVNGGLSSSTILNPIAIPPATTTYTLTGSNAAGCTGSSSVTITVVPKCIEVGNAFSPNGDGINEYWLVYKQYDCLKNVSVHVFNRYGSKVFESKDYRNNWDGTYNGKALPDGTYYAVVDFIQASGKILSVKTDLTIIR